MAATYSNLYDIGLLKADEDEVDANKSYLTIKHLRGIYQDNIPGKFCIEEVIERPDAKTKNGATWYVGQYLLKLKGAPKPVRLFASDHVRLIADFGSNDTSTWIGKCVVLHPNGSGEFEITSAVNYLEVERLEAIKAAIEARDEEILSRFMYFVDEDLNRNGVNSLEVLTFSRRILDDFTKALAREEATP